MKDRLVSFQEIVRLFATTASTGSEGVGLMLSFNGLAKSDRAKMNGAVMVMCFCCLLNQRC